VWSVLLVEETGVPVENHRPATRHWQTLSHNVVSSTLRHEQGLKTKSINREVLIGPHVYVETGYVLLVKSKTSVLKNNRLIWISNSL
jgi:hypothetical protein